MLNTQTSYKTHARKYIKKQVPYFQKEKKKTENAHPKNMLFRRCSIVRSFFLCFYIFSFHLINPIISDSSNVMVCLKFCTIINQTRGNSTIRLFPTAQT